MSDYRAIAAVTATIRNMLVEAVSSDADLADTTVTTRPPDRARPPGAIGNQINLFLYRASADLTQQKPNLPGIHPGDSLQSPLALVLSYLMTAYGQDDEDIFAHRLLGVGMRTLHDQPVLSTDTIAAAFPGSGLEGQADRVRITLIPIPMTDMSGLWASLSTGYRISVGYDVAVVLID
jgi:hypothetical protein